MRPLTVSRENLKAIFVKRTFFIRNIETMLISSTNGTMSPLPEAFKRTYANDIDMHKLSLQPQLLPDAIKSSPTKIKEVTKV